MTETPTPSRRRPEGGASLVMYQFGGRTYPLRTVAQCKVCQSPHRFDVENQIAAGRTYATIARDLLLADPDCDLSAANVNSHFANGHMPLEQEATRRIVERRAIERGKNVDSGVDNLVDGMALAEAVVQKAFEALQRGELRPDLKEGLAAAKILETYTPLEDGVSQDVYAEVFMIYHDTAQAIMTPSQFEEFGRRLSGNEVLRALVAKHSDRQPQEEPLEGEVVEEAASLGKIDNDPIEG